MISSNELRIANFVLHDGKVMFIREWVRGGADLKFPEGHVIHACVKFEYMEPIPLTREWIMKFGLKPFAGKSEPTSKAEVFHLLSDSLLSAFSSDEFKVILEDGYNNEHLELTSVHQLQNLYFALTGKELEIKSLQTS